MGKLREQAPSTLHVRFLSVSKSPGPKMARRHRLEKQVAVSTFQKKIERIMRSVLFIPRCRHSLTNAVWDKLNSAKITLLSYSICILMTRVILLHQAKRTLILSTSPLVIVKVFLHQPSRHSIFIFTLNLRIYGVLYREVCVVCDARLIGLQAAN